MPNKCTNPMCAFTYDRRNRPEICPKCSVFLGPVKENNVKEKRKKKVAVPNPKHVTVDLGGGIYSVQYHQHSRCIVKIEEGEGIHFCDQKKCTETRRFNIRNHKQFLCAHIQKVLADLESGLIVHMNTSFDPPAVRMKIDVLPLNAKTAVLDYIESVEDFKVMKLTEWSYVVKTPPSNRSSQDLVHVSMKNDSSNFVCANGSGCTRFRVKVSKKRTTSSLCPHEHIVMVVSGKNVRNAQEAPNDAQADKSFGSHLWLENTSKFLYKSRRIEVTDSNLKRLEHIVMDRNKRNTWPSLYQSNLEVCPECNQALDAPVRHSGLETSHLLTHDTFKEVTVLVQKCYSCCIVLQPFDECLLNIGDSLLVSVDLMFLMCALVHAGCPLSTVAETLIMNVGLRNELLYSLKRTQKDWICRLLTSGYKALECLDNDEEESQLCGFCGIIPEAMLGDGGEDVSCVLESWHLERTDEEQGGVFPAEYVDSFLDGLKCFFLEALVFPRVHMGRRFPMNFTTVPPFLTRSNRGHSVYNTELEKDTRFTDSKVLLGNQQLLMQLINTRELNIEALNDYSSKQLNDILIKIGVEKRDIRKLASKMAKSDVIITLYKSVESGYSQCHHTGNRKKASGGWYNESCLHGCIVASKMLFLSESVRDPIDIKLSKRYNSPTNILDTPCTAASNLATRDPDLYNLWFGDRQGCAETPTLEKGPSLVSIPKLKFENRHKTGIVLHEVKDLPPHADPKTGDCDKFFVGDRFHEANFPHSSELCRYHDINNIPELDAAKTSSQEVLNFTRNWRRLRTTCTQNAETHLLYNLVMDRSHNRKIVKRQAEDLNMVVTDRHPDYLHFIQ